MTGRGGYVPAGRHVLVRCGRGDHVLHGRAGSVPHMARLPTFSVGGLGVFLSVGTV